MSTRTLAVAAFVAWTGLSYVALYGQSGRTVWDGVYTREQAERGAALYPANCAGCHGTSLEGAEGPALAGPDFNANWNTLTLGDLFERIRTSMPQDNPEKLSVQEKVDILAHMLNVGKFPAGTMDLPRDGQVLGQIRYLSMKP